MGRSFWINGVLFGVFDCYGENVGGRRDLGTCFFVLESLLNHFNDGQFLRYGKVTAVEV